MPLIHLDSSRLAGALSQDFTVLFNPSIRLELTKQYEIALVRANLWYSWHNISSVFGNHQLRYHNGTQWQPLITIPNGMYSISQINDYLQAEITANGDTPANLLIEANYSTLRCDITIANGYQLDLTQSTLNELLGFTSKVVNASESGTSSVDITRGVNSLNIHCSIVDSSATFDNNEGSTTIMSFTPKTGFGTNLAVEPRHLLYVPIAGSSINRIQMTLTDQSNNIVDLNGETVSYMLHIREQHTD